MNTVRHLISRDLRGAARKAFRTVALLCVFSSLWQAPLPWVHCHVKSTNFEITQRLDRHLTTWHSDVAERGWHLHFAMLGDILRGGGCPVPPEQGDELPATEHVLLVDLVPGAGAVLLAPTELAFGEHDVSAETPDCSPQVAPRRQFLGDYAESHRLQTVLCIAQC